ncbi:DUF3889 domain-containing protein [Bacillus sp. V2I10]|uniref:DUF3889 domain-containing protein n=1 Tax=Bacillus sp. V2I10 TaxID=3042276 RepID=UPI00277D304D|nr:DUF3889 domain-containing protein [Bacillus sp. V2I10]MDQ0862281.1 outer membrane biogenesis lipoprotein LolB [Bacillus sp. V2I10]
MNTIRKVMISILFIFLLLPATIGQAQPPDYAKWGKIAVEETKKQYPNAQISDYTYQGKVFISDERVQYNFEFSLITNQQKKKVHVYVLVNPKSDKLIDVNFDEIEQGRL